LTICCGLFCTASKILGALQAILHITCIFGVLQPPKCGSSVKKNAGLISPPPCFEPPRPWPPPPPAPRARPVRRSGRRSEKGGVLPPRALFRAKTPLFQSRRGQKPPLFRAARRPPESAAALTWENVPAAKRGRPGRSGAARQGALVRRKAAKGGGRRRTAAGRSGAAGETGEPRRGKRGSLRAAG